MTNILLKTKIHIVSRYVPISNRAGHFTYLLDLMRYVQRTGCSVELDVLDPWFLPENIPDELHELAHITLMPASYLKRDPAPRPMQSRQSLLRSIFRHLPPLILTPLRQWWYHWRGKTIPGHHASDAVATDMEMAFIKDRLARYQTDVFIANETFLGNLLILAKNDPRILKINIAFDVQHQRQKTFQQSTHPRPQTAWNRQNEAELLSAADLIVAIHEDDAATFREMVPQAEVICVPMAANLHVHPKERQVAGRCLFVGSHIAHNVQGLRWFLDDVWPDILQHNPTASLHVCGSVCRQFSRPYHQVRFLGRVEDLHEEYEAAAVCIIPLLAGSGLKIKLVDALSHGRACVATSIGVQGMRAIIDKAVLVSDTPKDFSYAVRTVLEDSEKCFAMETAARQYVVEHLAPEKVYMPLVANIEHGVRHHY